MKGNNTLTLNQASVIEAVQLLLDRDAPAAGKVQSVKGIGNGSSDGQDFVVAITVPEPTTAGL